MARILIVDDENNIRMMMRLTLQANGHQVETAVDGPDGLEKFGDGTAWDVVLLDQRMPGLEGLEVLRRMRASQPAARVIMISAFGTVDLAAEAARAGATDFLRKPFTTDILRGAVASALERSADAPMADSAPATGVRLPATTINGYRIEADNSDGNRTGPDSNAQVETPSGLAGDRQHRFVVRGPDGAGRRCTVLLPSYFVELIKAHVDSDDVPDGEHFWPWLCEETLANYLWQNAETPPDGLLVVTQLTASLRRWIDAILTG